MDRNYIELHDVVARYVKNDLSDPEREAFEDYYFEHPEMLEEIEVERLLRASMRAHGQQAEPAHRPGSRAPLFAVAASLLVGVMLGGLLPMPFDDGDAGVAQVQTAWLIVDRQGGPVEIGVATLGQPLALTIELSSGMEGALQAELFDARGKLLWSMKNMTVDSAGDLTLLMPTDILAEDAYILRLAQGGETVDEYRFKLSIVK
jgi:hypothetical protein